MYFVLKGTVKTISGDHFVNKKFCEGSYFGEHDIITNVVNIIYIYIYTYMCVCRISEMNQQLQQKSVNF